jgi:hypothetical protein
MDAWRYRLASQNQDLLDDDDDDEEKDLASKILIDKLEIETELPKMRVTKGSRLRKRPNVNREHQTEYEKIFSDCFIEYPMYSPELFQRCYQMQHPLFLQILQEVCAYNLYFVQKCNVTYIVELSSIKKSIAALYMLIYDIFGDAIDEYYKLNSSMAIKFIK